MDVFHYFVRSDSTWNEILSYIHRLKSSFLNQRPKLSQITDTNWQIEITLMEIVTKKYHWDLFKNWQIDKLLRLLNVHWNIAI